jgi:hypothetical protein
MAIRRRRRTINGLRHASVPAAHRASPMVAEALKFSQISSASVHPARTVTRHGGDSAQAKTLEVAPKWRPSDARAVYASRVSNTFVCYFR